MHLPHVGQSQSLPQSHLFPAGQTTFFLLDLGRGGVGLASCVDGPEDAAFPVPELLEGGPGREGPAPVLGGAVGLPATLPP